LGIGPRCPLSAKAVADADMVWRLVLTPTGLRLCNAAGMKVYFPRHSPRKRAVRQSTSLEPEHRPSIILRRRRIQAATSLATISPPAPVCGGPPGMTRREEEVVRVSGTRSRRRRVMLIGTKGPL